MAFEYYTNYGSFLRQDYKYPDFDYNLDPRIYEYGPPFYGDIIAAIWVGSDPFNFAYIELTGNTVLEIGHTYGELSNLEVNSALTDFNGSVVIDGTLTVGGNTVLIDGTSNSIQIGTGITLVGSGNTSLNIQGTFYSDTISSSNLSVDTLNVTGISTFNNDINCNDIISVGNLNITGISTFTSVNTTNIINSGNLNVIGISTFNDKVGINTTTINRTLDIEGDLEFRAGVGSTPTGKRDILFEYVDDFTLRINMKGDDGVVRSSTLSLS